MTEPPPWGCSVTLGVFRSSWRGRLGCSRSGERALALIAIATGIATGAGQVPGLEMLFYLANAGFLTWYVGLIVRFRPPRRARAEDVNALIGATPTS